MRYAYISAEVEHLTFVSHYKQLPGIVLPSLINWASVIQSLGLNKMAGLKFGLMMSERLKVVCTEWSKTKPSVSRVLILRGEVPKHTVNFAAMVLRLRII